MGTINAIRPIGDRSLTYLDHASTITLGGTAQTVMAANSSREGLFIYNESDTNMRIAFGSTTASSTLGFLLVPGYYWEPPIVAREIVTVFCTTTGKAYSAGEWS